MEQSEFDKRFSNIQMMYKREVKPYRFKNETDVWGNIGSLPLDKFFIKLAELYLDSSEHQKLELFAYCGQQKYILEYLWYFIRRIGKLIHSKDDKKWLEIGIAGALMDGGRADNRDLIISLLLLRYISENNEINTGAVFDTFIQSAEGFIKGRLEYVRDEVDRQLLITVQKFGPPEWVAK